MPPEEKQYPDIQAQTLEQQNQSLVAQIDALKVQVLDEAKKLELKKLEEEKKKIEEAILKKNQTETDTLKQDIEISNKPSPKTFEIIRETWLYTKLQETFKDTSIYPDLNWNIDAKIERFSNNINTTIQKYLESSFLPIWEKKFPEAALTSINTWIQFLLMDALKNSNNSSSFFSSFGKVDLSWFKSLLNWLTKTFTKSWEFLSIWKKITKTIDFLSQQSSLWDNADKIPQLMNPCKFIELTNNQKLQSTKDVLTLSLSDLWIQQWDTSMTTEELDYLKKIAENSAIKNDPKVIKGIISSLGTAGLFLEKRKDLANWALDMMDKANWLLAPFEKLLWVNVFDMLKPFKWVLNMVLSLLWFSWWLDWLHKRRLLRKIDWQLDTQEKKDFMSDSMSDFKKNISESAVKETDSASVISLYKREIGDISSDIKAKIPLDYNVICNSIKDNLKNPEIINPFILQDLGWNRNNLVLETTDDNWAKAYKIDKDKFSGKEADFIKAYTSLVIPRLINNTKFMKDIAWQDEFWLAVMWWVVVDQKNILEWISAKAIIPSQYIIATVAVPAVIEDQTQTPVNPTEIQPETQTYKWEITKETTKYENIVDVIITTIEGWYYNPDMKIWWMWSSWETMMGIDRAHWWDLNTSEAWKEFWSLIDADRSKNPDLWKHLYFGGDLEPKLRILAWNIIKPHYENLSKKYLSEESLKLVNTDWRLLFNFIYGAWNGEGRFEKMANVINSKVSSWTKNLDELLKAVVDFRTQNDNPIIAQWGRKIEKIVGMP